MAISNMKSIILPGGHHSEFKEENFKLFNNIKHTLNASHSKFYTEAHYFECLVSTINT